MTQNDDKPLFSASHYAHYYATTTWYQRLWHRVKGLFVRPKFSADNIDHAAVGQDFTIIEWGRRFHPTCKCNDV